MKKCIQKLALLIGVACSAHIFSYGEAAGVKEIGYFTKPVILCNKKNGNLLFLLPYTIDNLKKAKTETAREKNKILRKASSIHLESFKNFLLELSHDYISKEGHFNVAFASSSSYNTTPFPTSTSLKKSFGFTIASWIGALKPVRFIYDPPETNDDPAVAYCSKEIGLLIKKNLATVVDHFAERCPLGLFIVHQHDVQQISLYAQKVMSYAPLLNYLDCNKYPDRSKLIIGLIHSLFSNLDCTAPMNLKCFSESCTLPALEACKECRFFWHCSSSSCKGYTSHIKVCPKIATENKMHDYLKTTSISILSSDSSPFLNVYREKPSEGLKKSKLYMHSARDSTHYTNVCKTYQEYCITCKKATDERCSICKAAFYCSSECQENDWKTHQQQCAKLKEHKYFGDQMRYYCSRRGCKTITSKPISCCPACKIFKYCSQACQQADLLQHQLICIKRQCTTCEKQLKTILQCQTCKSTWYCSKDCQKADWKAGHKQTCKAPLFPYHKLDID